MTQTSTTIRVALEQRDQLRRLADQRGSSMTDTLSAALLALKRELFYEQMAAAEARLQEDKGSWDEFVNERDEWLNALPDSA